MFGPQKAISAACWRDRNWALLSDTRWLCNWLKPRDFSENLWRLWCLIQIQTQWQTNSNHCGEIKFCVCCSNTRGAIKNRFLYRYVFLKGTTKQPRWSEVPLLKIWKCLNSNAFFPVSIEHCIWVTDVFIAPPPPPQKKYICPVNLYGHRGGIHKEKQGLWLCT